jgi:alpha-1,2-rhamnosyltransferase
MRSSLNAVQLLEPARRIKQQLRPLLSARRSEPVTALRPGIALGRGDILVVVDLEVGEPFWQSVRLARQNGARIGVLVYDLIPLQHPETCDSDEFVADFQRWWRTIHQDADFLLCYSQSTLDEIQSYPRPTGSPTNAEIPIGLFGLGADLDGCREGGDIRPKLCALLDGPAADPTYLMVGWLALRKNHVTVLEAFERAWAAGSAARLLIVGKEFGPAAKNLSRRIKTHPEHGRRLFWFDDISDCELEFCYRNGTALIAASFAEGFNLPILEARSRGLPVLAADIPIHREVAGSRSLYFSPFDAEHLAELITSRRCCSLRREPLEANEFRWPSWRDSCHEFLSRVLELAAPSETQATQLPVAYCQS